MRKISVGSFPLIDINPANRKFIESYLINTLSDLISVNQISAGIYDDRAKFITPTVIMDYFKTNPKLDLNKNIELKKDASIDYRIDKAISIKNAFKNTKNLYRSISNDPFYKNNIFYPIYIEEKIKGQNGYVDYKYDFLILSNDLIKQQILDEITYDDNITVLFLVLKDILFPMTKLTSIGLRDSNFRRYFSIYLETCKNENINPFDMFVKIIKFAGNERMYNKGGSSRNLFSKIINHGTTETFRNLFDTKGEIKDVNQLLNFTQKQIGSFLKDNTRGNQVDTSTFNPIARQYAQAKTHEYAKILSIIDSLVLFNKQLNITDEINDNQMIKKLTLEDNSSLNINIDGLLNDLEIIYFKSFLDSLISIDESIVTLVSNNLYSVVDNEGVRINLYGNDLEDIKRTTELINNNKDKLTLENNTIINQLRNIGKIINDNFKIIDASNQNEFDNYARQQKELSDILTTNRNTLNDLDKRLGLLDARSYGLNKVSEKDAENIRRAIVKAGIGIDFELYKSHLTALYGELYTYFYSEDFQKDIVNLNNKSLNSLNDLTGNIISQIKLSLNELNSLFLNNYIGRVEEFFNDEIYLKYNANNKINQNIKQTAIKRISEKISINTDMQRRLLETIIIPIFKKYGNTTIMEAQRIKNLRAEKNPLLRKLLSDSNMFKAFIINEETILGVYDILHYLDTLKYEVGLISNPVSQVTNKINKINFIINRLGIDNNPVFVINQNEITLSMPNHLSLTGQNFINRIPKQDFLKIANISFDKTLWSQNGMFGTGSDNILSQKKKLDLDKINREIQDANIALKQAKSITDDKKKKVAIAEAKQQLANAQYRQKSATESYEKAKQNSQESTTLSGNLNPRLRNDYQRVWRHDGYNGPYDSNMDTNGRYNYENENVNNIRNNMNNLANQSSRFINNPHIQNRYREINGRPQQFTQNRDIRLGDNYE